MWFARRRLLLVDENDDFLDGLAAWIEKDPRFRVVGRAHSTAQALERVQSLAPDIALIDVKLPDGSGFDLTRNLKSIAESPLIVLLSFHHRTTVQQEAKAAGADDCLSKSDLALDLMPTLHALGTPQQTENP